MKRLFITIFLLFPVLVFPSTWFASANTGNDGNDGTSWAQAMATLGGVEGLAISAGDTIVCVGEFSEVWNMSVSGTSGNSIIAIDSVRYTDGFDEADPDTAWSAIINGTDRCIEALSQHDFRVFIGFEFYSADAAEVDFGSGVNDWKVQQCRIFNHNGTGINERFIITGGASRDSLISCVIISNGDVGYGFRIGSSGAGDFYIANNTFYGTWSGGGFFVWGSSGTTFKNNILVQLSSTTNDYLVEVRSTASIGDFDNNLYRTANTTDPWNFFDDVDIALFTVWVDSVNNHDADGEANSDSIDASLQAVATTCYITSGSAAFGAGEDLGFGTSIGYFQPAAAAAGGRKTVPQIIQIKKRRKTEIAAAAATIANESNVILDTEAAAALDTVTTLTGVIGQLVYISTRVAARDVRFLDSGNFNLSAEITLDDPADVLTLKATSATSWKQVNFSDNN